MDATAIGSGGPVTKRGDEESRISRLAGEAEELLRRERRALLAGEISEAVRLNGHRLGLQDEASRLRLRLISGDPGLG